MKSDISREIGIFDTCVHLLSGHDAIRGGGGEGGYIEQVRNEEQGMGNDD